jgi:hypothetical protein
LPRSLSMTTKLPASSTAIPPKEEVKSVGVIGSSASSRWASWSSLLRSHSGHDADGAQKGKERELYYNDKLGAGEYSHVNVSKVIAIARHMIAQSVLLEDFVRFLLFMVLFCTCIILQRNPPASNGVVAAITNRIGEKPFRSSTNQIKQWKDIVHVDDWWDWHQTALLDSFYVDTYYSGAETSLVDDQTVMQHIRLIDGIRLTQRRVKNMTCLSGSRRYAQFAPNCYGSTYSNGLLGYTDEKPFRGAVSGTTFKHTKKNLFESGYYYYLCGAACVEDSRRKLDALRLDKWTNTGTSYLRTDFVAYNPNVGLFAAVELSMTVSPTGKVKPKLYVQCVEYMYYATTDSYVRLGLEIMFMIFLAISLALQAQASVKMAYIHKNAFACLNFWFLYDWVLLLSMLVCVFVRLYLVLANNFSSIVITEPSGSSPSFTIVDKDGEMLDVGFTTMVSFGYFGLAGLIAGFSSIKMIRFLRVNIQMSVLTQTFVAMSSEILVFLGILYLLLVLWGAMATLFFGAQVPQFRDLPTSWTTCWQLFVGLTDKQEIYAELPTDEYYSKPIEADLFYYPFSIAMQFVVLNVTIGVIMTAYTKVLSNYQDMKEDSIVSFLVERLFAEQVELTDSLTHSFTHTLSLTLSLYLSLYLSLSLFLSFSLSFSLSLSLSLSRSLSLSLSPLELKFEPYVPQFLTLPSISKPET